MPLKLPHGLAFPLPHGISTFEGLHTYGFLNCLSSVLEFKLHNGRTVPYFLKSLPSGFEHTAWLIKSAC